MAAYTFTDHVYDVVVVGAGGSGLRATLGMAEQGLKTEAARVAQDAYANAVAARTAQMAQNLGALERGWHAVRSAAKWAWDEMAGIGRPQTISDKLDAARKKLEAAGITADEIKAIDQDIRKIVNASADFAETSPEPDPGELYTDVLVEQY